MSLSIKAVQKELEAAHWLALAAVFVLATGA
jgi:hypothetical protein